MSEIMDLQQQEVEPLISDDVLVTTRYIDELRIIPSSQQGFPISDLALALGMLTEIA